MEPDPKHAAIGIENFRLKAVRGEVMQAAVGSQDCWTRFSPSAQSNLGRLEDNCCDSIVFPMISMRTLLERQGSNSHIDLLQVEMEGAEELLVQCDRRWFRQVDAFLMELHDSVAKSQEVASAIISQGFEYVPAGSVHPLDYDCISSVQVSLTTMQIGGSFCTRIRGQACCWSEEKSHVAYCVLSSPPPC